MKTVEKKLWPDYFDLDKNTSNDFKLADFDLQDGDQIKFREWDPQTKEYTGREYTRKVKKVLKHESPTRYWPQEELEKYGMYIIEWK
ncbi:MAG: DUF3850 domain-containing protein [bacterium]|nr:DUF3850 domain-containing protein [bacterium]